MQYAIMTKSTRVKIRSMPEKLETVLDKISTITYTHQIFSYFY